MKTFVHMVDDSLDMLSICMAWNMLSKFLIMWPDTLLINQYTFLMTQSYQFEVKKIDKMFNYSPL